jgi:hypothetical protein
MIRVNGIEIAMEGDFGTLIKEAARIAHAIARAASDKFYEETDGEVDYDHIVEMILEELAQLKRLDNGKPGSGVGMDIPQELKDDFYNLLQEEREANAISKSKSFVDYDTSRPNANVGQEIIQSAIKDVFIDNRTKNLDQDDLDIIKKEKKKKKK